MAARWSARRALTLGLSLASAVALGMAGASSGLVRVWLVATTLALVGFAPLLTAARVTLPPRLVRHVLIGLAAWATLSTRHMP